MRQDIYSGNHPEIATSLNNIGIAYYSVGDYQEALKYLKRAFEMDI